MSRVFLLKTIINTVSCLHLFKYFCVVVDEIQQMMWFLWITVAQRLDIAIYGSCDGRIIGNEWTGVITVVLVVADGSHNEP